MTKHHILYYPDPKLRELAKPVETIDDQLKQLVEDMFDIMYKNQGGGLAAPQIGIPLQIAIIDDEEHPPFVLINPEIVLLSDNKIENVEGCLSVPGVSAPVTRPNYVKVKAQDIYGKPFEIEASDNYLARCLQHEIDHLYGKLYVDYLSPMKRDRLVGKMKKHLRRILNQ